MEIRTSDDRNKSNKPDRTKASWNNKGSEKQESPPEASLPTEKKAYPPSQPAPIGEKPAFQAQLKSTPRKSGSQAARRASRAGTPLPRFLVLALVLVISMAALGFFLVQAKKKPLPKTPVDKVRTIDAEIAEMDLKTHAGPLPHVVAMDFANSSDPAERLKLCLNPDRVALLISSFPEQARTEIPIGGRPLGGSTAGDLRIYRLEPYFANGETRIMPVVHTDEGPKVDWEAYARYGYDLQRWMREAKNPQFVRDEETAVVRVEAIKDHYYNFRFQDEETWKSYSISSPDLEEGVVAYAKVGSTAAKILEAELFVKKRVSLQLRSRTDDAKNKQYDIVKLLAMGWVIPEDDFETKWLNWRASLEK